MPNKVKRFEKNVHKKISGPLSIIYVWVDAAMDNNFWSLFTLSKKTMYSSY